MSPVGYHKESKDISPVYSEGVWSRNGIGGGKINGADASLPTNVVLPEAGKLYRWPIIRYFGNRGQRLTISQKTFGSREHLLPFY